MSPSPRPDHFRLLDELIDDSSERVPFVPYKADSPPEDEIRRLAIQIANNFHLIGLSGADLVEKVLRAAAPRIEEIIRKKLADGQ